MTRVIGFSFLLMGVAGYAFGAVAAPEIDANSAVSALTLLSGAVLVLRTRRSK